MLSTYYFFVKFAGMKNLRKYLEIFLFALMNIFFVSAIFAWTIFLKIFNILGYLLNVNEKILEQHEFEFILILFFAYLLYMFFKIFLFPLIYLAKKQFPYIHKWFNSFFEKTKYQSVMLIISLVIPFLEAVVVYLINDASVLWLELLCGYGVLPSYLIMYFYMKVFAKNNLK